MGLVPAPVSPFTQGLMPVVLGDISFPDLLEWNQEGFKFRRIQAREGTKNAGLVFEGMIGKHGAPCRVVGEISSVSIGGPAYHSYFG